MDGTTATLGAINDCLSEREPSALPVGGSPTGAGESPAVGIFRTPSEHEPTDLPGETLFHGIASDKGDVDGIRLATFPRLPLTDFRERVPILVTGAHRCGTTWVGKILSFAGCHFVWEPLNPSRRPGAMSAKANFWYTYINDGNEAEYLPSLLRIASCKYDIQEELRSLRSPRDFLSKFRDISCSSYARIRGKRVVIKDPFAVFSVRWFMKRLKCYVVVMIRHPLGFVASLKKLSWFFDFRNLLNQPLLMRDLLEPYRKEMEDMRADDLIAQAALLWRIIYAVTPDNQQHSTSLILVRTEDLAESPLPMYESLYKRLGLPFTARIKNKICAITSKTNPSESPLVNAHTFRLNSRSNREQWRKHLAPDDIKRIRAITEAVTALYYPDESWT
jgi:hypothetical protein